MIPLLLIVHISIRPNGQAATSQIGSVGKYTKSKKEKQVARVYVNRLVRDIHQVVVHESRVRIVVFGVHETEAVLFVERDCI